MSESRTRKCLSLQIRPADDLTVVGVGASAGGLGAVGELLQHLARDLNMGFVIIQRSSPRKPGDLCPRKYLARTQSGVWCRERAIGIVLGTATDGTLGLKRIKAEGGITFAQNHTARFDSMPWSAIAADAVDFVLSPRQIAEELIAIARRPERLDGREIPAPGDGVMLERVLLMLKQRISARRLDGDAVCIQPFLEPDGKSQDRCRPVENRRHGWPCIGV